MCRNDTKTGSQRDQGLCCPDTEAVRESPLEMYRNDTKTGSQRDLGLCRADTEAVSKIIL